jgi:hypothetical protein
LEKLRAYRSLADEILALLEETELDEDIIDWIIKLIEDEVKKQKTEKSKQKFTLVKEIIKKIKEQEKNEKIENIDDILNQI